MGATDANSNGAIGFLTVIEHPEHGLFGGYLLLNPAGRPLEFHCTAPVKPNRAQEILYGATLQPYLFGEQIGQTLLRRARQEPLAICTDREPALAVQSYTPTPVALILPTESADGGREPHDARDETGAAVTAAMPRWRLDRPHPTPALVAFRLGRNRLALPPDAEPQRAQIEARLGGLADWFDLGEPFQRIREAIEEARRGGQ